jgi:hypothetical protein
MAEGMHEDPAFPIPDRQHTSRKGVALDIALQEAVHRREFAVRRRGSASDDG